MIKTSEKPFGGGGVGKSHLIKSIYQAALKYYNSRAGEDFRRVQIMLLAPTRKAAYLIKSNTIHSLWYSRKSVSKELQTIRFWEIKHNEMRTWSIEVDIT